MHTYVDFYGFLMNDKFPDSVSSCMLKTKVNIP